MNYLHPDATRYEVYCNGQLLKYCIAADEDEGRATVYACDGDGKLKRADLGRCGELDVVIEVLRGHIEIKPMAPEFWMYRRSGE